MPARKNIEKKEKSIIDDLLDKVGLVDFKETMGQVVDYIEDFFTSLKKQIEKEVKNESDIKSTDYTTRLDLNQIRKKINSKLK